MVKAVNRTAAKFLDQKITGIFPLNYQEGDNGVEIEVEGANLPIRIPGGLWNAIDDHSLRGESKEYVFAKPLNEVDTETALRQLAEEFVKHKSKINDSYRTSVHVHVNVQELTMRQLYNFITLYITFEDILIDMCGRERDGNLFCLRVTDAEQLVESLKSLPMHGNINQFQGDGMRYASFNINSVGKYGSLEFRAYRGTTKTEDILVWVKLLNTLRNAAKQFADPQEIVSNFSKLGYRQFTANVFGNNALSDYIMNARDAEKRLLDGARYAQEIAFCVKSWSLPVKNNDDEERIYAAMKKNALGDIPIRRIDPFVGLADQMAERVRRAPAWAVMPFVEPQPQEDEEI